MSLPYVPPTPKIEKPTNPDPQDVGFNGGLIHIIDTVLTVPPSVAQTAVNTGLTSLAGAATAAQLADTLNGLSDLTIFAPSNDAFKAIGSVITTLSPQTLAGILNYHVLPRGVRFSTDLIAAGSPVQFTTAQGQNLTVSRLNGQLFVNSAKILIPDVITANGVVHVIDKYVLIPPLFFVWCILMCVQRPQPAKHHGCHPA